MWADGFNKRMHKSINNLMAGLSLKDYRISLKTYFLLDDLFTSGTQLLHFM